MEVKALEDSKKKINRLAETCLAYTQITKAHAFGARSGGCPAGRPTRETVREAGSVLTALTEDSSDPSDIAGHIIGSISSNIMPEWTGDPANPGPEMDRAIVAGLAAIDTAESIGDNDLRAWALSEVSALVRRGGDFRRALQLAERARKAAFAALESASGPWSLMAAAGEPEWMEEGDVYRHSIAVVISKQVGMNSSTLGDYTKWKEALEDRHKMAAVIRSERPVYYAQSFAGFAAFARSVGDRRAILRSEKELEDFIGHDGPNNLKRVLLACKAASAQVMRDWTAMYVLNQERLQSVLLAVKEQAIEAGLPDPGSDVDHVLEFLKGRGERALSAGLGNACLGQATALYRRGDTRTSQEAYAEALHLLDVANKAYEGYGSNGFASTQLTRTRILQAAPGGDGISAAAAVAAYLRLSRVGLEAGVRRNSVLDAAAIAVPGDPAVIERIRELRAETQVAHPKLQAVEALWFYRGAAAELPGFDWAEAERLTVGAAEALVVKERPIDPLLAVDCWLAAIEAHEHIHGETGLDVRLPRMMRAVSSLAMHLVTVTYASERARAAQQYSKVFVAAADAAASLGDSTSAEIIMEAVRRDRVGILLGELSRNPQVHDTIRLAAQQLVVANAAVPDIPDDIGARSFQQWTTRSVVDIKTNQATAAAEAGKVIGPASTLADFNEFPKIRSGEIAVETIDQERPGVVLQLFRPSRGPENDGQTLYWVLTVSAAKGKSDACCGKTQLPMDPDDLPPANDPTFWTELYQLSEYLLPRPLRDLLRDSHGNGAVTLTIVPTGLLNVPFDSLVVAEDEGLMLIDCATVILTGSLAVTHSIGVRDAEGPAGSWLGVYDTNRLSYAKHEKAAMLRSHTAVATAETAEELHAAFGAGAVEGVDVLTLAVHGSAETSGWGQSKLMPDGSILRAVDVLRWNAPQYCVLSSCHSSLAANESTELSGFPIALILRGASTVIGSLHEIDDASTAEIMSDYWARAGRRTPAAKALAEAKRSWLEQHPESRNQPWLWAGLVAYGRP
jgi:hypothetical protein